MRRFWCSDPSPRLVLLLLLAVHPQEAAADTFENTPDDAYLKAPLCALETSHALLSEGPRVVEATLSISLQLVGLAWTTGVCGQQRPTASRACRVQQVKRGITHENMVYVQPFSFADPLLKVQLDLSNSQVHQHLTFGHEQDPTTPARRFGTTAATPSSCGMFAYMTPSAAR